jgi:hypothetical protein
MKMFENWCALHGLQPIPSKPSDIARFISDCSQLGVEKIWPVIEAISKAHINAELADPCCGVVLAALNSIAGVNPPRSWPKQEQIDFASMPYPLQVYVAGAEAKREKVLRRAQNEAAEAKKRSSPVATLLEQRKQTDGIRPNTAA